MGTLTDAYNITMYPEDWEIVSKLQAELGTSRSGAVRAIVRQYDEQQQEVQPCKANPA